MIGSAAGDTGPRHERAAMTNETRSWVPFHVTADDIDLWSGNWRRHKPGWYYFTEGPDPDVAGPFASENDAARDIAARDDD
jgi:hypothetical protein